MTLAETIAKQAMVRLGFREPEMHSKWSDVVACVQDEIDAELEAMQRVAGLDADGDDRDEMIDDLVAKVDRLQSALIAIANDSIIALHAGIP